MLSVSAQTVTIGNLDYTKGEAGSFDICLKTDANTYSAYAFYMFLPEGVNFKTKKGKVVGDVEDGDAVTDDNEMVYTFSESTKLPAKSGYKQYMLAAYDKDGEVLNTSAGGSLCTVNFLASDLDVEVLPVIIELSQFSTPTGQSEQSTEIISAIINLNTDKAANGAVAYDLTGRKTTTNAPGVKVINGKKVIK
jgi:hypothetical protein